MKIIFNIFNILNIKIIFGSMDIEKNLTLTKDENLTLFDKKSTYRK